MRDVPLGQRLFGGAMWVFAMRWVMRLLSVISIATLARLLEKEDFGLVALASAAITLPAVLTDLGVEQAIISQRLPERGIYNTAWTVRAIQLALAAGLVYFAGPWIADFYGDPRIGPMIQVLSAMILLTGFENIWTVSFRKELNFRRDFAYDASCKLIAVIMTVGLAIVLRSYWALVYGQLAAAALRVGLSLVLAPEWPRPTLSHWRQIWAFSQWSLAKGAATYLVQNGDRLIIGRLSTAEAVGAYSIGREIAETPISEISMPVNRVLGPGLSALQNEPERLAQALTKSLGAVATIAFPIGIGLALTAEHLIPVFLGDGWTESIPVVQILAFASLISSIRGVMGNTLAVTGHIRTSAIVMWLRGLLLIAMGMPGAMVAGAQGMAWAFLISEALAACVTLFFYRTYFPMFRIGNLAQALLRPACSALVMAAFVVMVPLSITSALLILVSKVIIGALSYCAIVYLLWYRSGLPDGLERLIFERIGMARKAG